MLEEAFLSVEEEPSGRRSHDHLDIDDLRNKLKEDSQRKKRATNRSFGSDEEESKLFLS